MQATGILADGPVLRWATLKQSRGSLKIKALATRMQGDQVKQLYLPSETGVLVRGLPSNDLLIHTTPFTARPSRHFSKALLLQAQAQLHLDPKKLITIPLFDPKALGATVYSTTTEALSTHLEAFKKWELDPARVSAIPSALKTFLQWKAPEIPSCFIVDLGWESSHCVWIEQGLVQKAHACEMGIQSLRAAFQEDRKRLISLKEQDGFDFTSIKSGQYPLFIEEARKLRRELSKLLASFQCQRPLVFTGEIEAKGLREFLWELLRDAATEERRLNLPNEEIKEAICLGLAKEYLTVRDAPLQFRASNNQSPAHWRMLGKIAIALLTASLLASAAVYDMGSRWIDRRKQQVLANLNAWDLSRFGLEEQIYPDEDVESLVEKWHRQIAIHSKNYPFLVKACKASQALEWLFSHPLLEQLQVEQFHYKLVSYPHIDSLREPYRVLVELTLKCSHPMQARRFHEALLQGNDRVDPEQEITWEMDRDRIRTSFYLKNEQNNLF